MASKDSDTITDDIDQSKESLDRIHSTLKALGNPEKKLPPVIHVAGTNGKGSTIAILRAIAEAAGHRVHVYTSPHLVREVESVRVAGKLIEEETLEALLQRVENAVGSGTIAEFEATTIAALLAFSETSADLCIIEVGLGGRSDATNVFKKPAAVGITPVSFDHQEFLGETLAEIARHKAGIIKPGAPLVVGPQKKVALEVIQAEAGSHGVKPYLCDESWHVETKRDGSGLLYEDWKSVLDLPPLPLAGAHQTKNAAMAIALAHAQKAVTIPDAAIKAGLGWVRWPARLQEIKHTSYNELLPQGSDLWLDGGHNPAAAEVMRTFLQAVDPVERSITLVIGMMKTKDARGYLKPLAGLVNRVITVPIPDNDKAMTPATLAATATDVGINGLVAKDVPSALGMITEKAHPERPPFVVIAGSLYLAGNVLKQLDLLPN